MMILNKIKALNKLRIRKSKAFDIFNRNGINLDYI